MFLAVTIIHTAHLSVIYFYPIHTKFVYPINILSITPPTSTPFKWRDKPLAMAFKFTITCLTWTTFQDVRHEGRNLVVMCSKTGVGNLVITTGPTGCSYLCQGPQKNSNVTDSKWNYFFDLESIAGIHLNRQ